MEEETVVETPPWEAFKPANSGPWQDFAAPSGPWADFQSAPVDRAMRKADLQAQQAAARSELLPRLAVQLVEPSPPAGLYRDMEQGFAQTRPNTLEQFSQPLANPLNAQTVARGLDVLAGAAEFARQGAVNPNASTAMDERLARDVQPGVGSQIAAGVQQAAAGLTSPAGAGLMAATAGVGALPRLAQRGVSAGFAAWMAANAGTNAGELVNAFEADDVEGFARAATSLGMDATFATLSGLHAVKGIAGDRVPTGNTRPDGTPETRPAAYAQAVNRWLTGQVEKNFTPEQVRDMYRRVNTGEATAQEQELVRVINRQIESPGQALRQGVDVTTPGQPLVSPWLRDFLALTQGEPGVRLATRQRPANGQQPPVDPAAAPPSPSAGQGERAGVRGLLADRAQPSPPETVPPEAVVPSTATPAPAGTPLPPPPALNPTPNPAPISSSLTQRPEAAMETRRAAPLGLQREPTVRPELAEAIAAIRAGYNPEVEASVSPTPTLNPNPAPPIEESLSPAVMPVPLERQAEFAAAAARAPWATDLKRQPTGWKIIKFREGATLVSLDGKQMIRFEAADKSSGTEALRKKMEAQAWAMDNPLSLGDSGPAPQTPSPTPPDQSGGPTELTPPATAPTPSTAKLASLQSRRDALEAQRKAEDGKPRKRGLRSALAIKLQNQVEELDAKIAAARKAVVPEAPKPDAGEQEILAEIARIKSVTGPLSQSERIDLNEIRLAAQDKTLSRLSQAYLENLEQRAAQSTPPDKADPSGVQRPTTRTLQDQALAAKKRFEALRQPSVGGGKSAEKVAAILAKYKAVKATAAAEWRAAEDKLKARYAEHAKLEEEATDWIADVVATRNAPKTADEAWRSFRKNMMADTRGTPVVDETTFKETWDVFATRLAADRAGREGQPQPTPPDQSGAPTELTPPAKGTAEPLSPTEVSEFNALEQARRAGTLDAAGATRYRELETRAGQWDLLMPAPPPLTPANVPTAAKVTPAQASQAANPKTEFNAKVAKEQKKFLLDAVDKALAEAPDTSPQEIQALWRASEHFAAKQKLEDYTKANPYPTAPNRYNFGYTDEELAKYQAAQKEFQKAQQEWQARRDAELQAVAEPYLAEMIGGADVNAALTEGTELAFYRSLPHVTIEVPGDGVFSIINTKDAIREFKERAAKFPTTAARAKAPTQARTGPSPVPALGELTKDNVLKAAALAMSTDPSRAIINTVWSDGQQTVATDGRRMHWFSKGIGGTVKKPAIVDAKGKPVTNLDRDYPNWQQVRPDKAEMEVVFTGQDAGKLWTVLKQAQQMTEERSNSVALWWNRDRTLGISSASPDAGTYEHNVQPKAKIMTALDPQYVMDALAAARGTGSERVDILWNDDMSPVVIQAPGFEAVIMPMRLSGPSPIFDPEMLTRYDLAATPETRRAMMKKDLAAIQRLGRPTGTEEVKAKWLKEQLGEVEDFAAEIARLEAKRKKEAAKPRTTAQKSAAQQRINAELQAEIDRLKAQQNASAPGGGSANASVGDFRAFVPARPAPVPEVPAGAGFADSGLFVDGVEVRLGGSGAVNPVLMPEMYRFFNELTGGDSPFLRRYRTANGMFYAAGAGRIGLHPDLFKFPHQAAYTFAHEVGHLGDYLPDRTLDRGNIFGSIGTLRQWLTTTFPLNPRTSLDDVLKPEDRRKLRSAAESEIRRTLGPRPSKEESEADWATWGNEVTRRYQELVEEEIDARGLVSLAQVREELLALTQWWKPYDPATAPESYRKYRQSARELYADALSVLFNSPGHLEQMAPTFYKMFWAWLDTKPEFKAALARTQELLAKGDAEVLRARVADDRADFEKGRAAFEAAHAEQERTFTDVRAITARLMRQFVDRGEALTELSAGPRLGGVLPQGMDPREAWEQMLMADNLIYQFSSAVAERVVKPLQDAGLNADTDIGVYLKHTRIQGNKSAREELDLIKARLGRATYTQAEKFADLMEELVRKGIAETQMIDRVILPAEAAGIEFDDITEISRLRLEQGTRVDIANPRLVQAAESERTLAQYLADLGPAKAEALEQAAAAFRDIVFNLVEQGHAAQVFTDRQLQTAQANRHTYAAFRPLDHVDTWVSWTMRRAKGSAKPIENPFVTTMLKMQGLAQAIMENRAKLATRDAMQPVAPESFVKAETYWTGRGQQAKPPAKDMARLIVREQGKPVAYDVDPAIAEAFEKLTPFEQDTAAAWVNWLFHKTLYRGYVSWSLPFNFWTNPNRDIRRTYLNLGAVFGKRAPSMTDLARAYKDAWADAKAYVAGELTPLSREAMEFYAIYAPTDAFYSQFPQDDPSHAIFVKLGLVAEPASKARAMADKVPVLKQALAVGDWVTRQGQQREAVGKLGTWLALRRAGFEPEQAAPFVRNYAGTPNTKVSGSGSAVPNAIFPFYRIWMQALRNWVKLVRNPKTRGGWMFRWAITTGTLRALLNLAGLGYFGMKLKDWIDGVPEYDRTRGVPVPVPPLALPGGDYGKKSLYLRLPDDEFSALMGYSLDNAMRAAAGQKGAGQAASDAAAQWLTSAPALNTFADLTAQWLAYAGNGVPEDRFRNRPVLTEPERKAGGAQAFGKMVAFSLDKAGVPMLRQPASEPGSTAEQVLRFTPLLKDMFKVSDAGFREKDMAQRDAVEQVKYAIRMDYGDDTKYLLHRHAVLDRAGTTRTLAQEAEYAFLKRWHADYNRLDAAIVAAQQQNERGEAKERIRDLETASTAYKTAMEQAKAERERPAGPRAVPWSPRLTNAVPARR